MVEQRFFCTVRIAWKEGGGVFATWRWVAGFSLSDLAKFLVPDWRRYRRLWHRVTVPARQAT
jgi:hypothetical protein